MAGFVLKTANEVLNALIERHPEQVAGMGPEEVTAWIANQKPLWIEKFAAYNQLDVSRVAQGNMCWGIEEDDRLAELQGSPVVPEQQGEAYFERCNGFARLLGALQIFDKPDYRMRSEYGGPF